MAKISYTVLVLLSIKLEVLEAAITAVLADTVGMVRGWRLFQRQQKVCSYFLLLFYTYLLL
jgi:hypothetical protein